DEASGNRALSDSIPPSLQSPSRKRAYLPAAVVDNDRKASVLPSNSTYAAVYACHAALRKDRTDGALDFLQGRVNRVGAIMKRPAEDLKPTLGSVEAAGSVGSVAAGSVPAAASSPGSPVHDHAGVVRTVLLQSQ